MRQIEHEFTGNLDTPTRHTLKEWLRTFIAARRAKRARRNSLADLHTLDDRLLRDIGVTRDEVNSAWRSRNN